MTDKGVEDREQDGSACAAKECKQQEQNIFDQQDDSTCASEEGGLQKEHLLNQRDLEQHKSSDQEADVMGHVENRQPLVECNSEAQMEAMKSSMAEGFTLHDLSHAKPNSNWPMPSGRTKHQEGITYSPEFNGPSDAKPSVEGDQTHRQSCSGSEPPTPRLFGVLVAQTPRAQQLFQEMASEGALLFPVQEDNNGGVASGMNPDFISTGLDEASDAVAFNYSCLELFPARQEHIGWAPGPGAAEASNIDLELSLAVPSRPNLQFSSKEALI